MPSADGLLVEAKGDGSGGQPDEANTSVSGETCLMTAKGVDQKEVSTQGEALLPSSSIILQKPVAVTSKKLISEQIGDLSLHRN